ncbi:hypothetical protein HK104_005964 [Borealophlyctis nickersoniae]|nr:hypothetical protein HK104_005964 [Borealophlyctis nickersoniae]
MYKDVMRVSDASAPVDRAEVVSRIRDVYETRVAFSDETGEGEWWEWLVELRTQAYISSLHTSTPTNTLQTSFFDYLPAFEEDDLCVGGSKVSARALGEFKVALDGRMQEIVSGATTRETLDEIFPWERFQDGFLLYIAKVAIRLNNRWPPELVKRNQLYERLMAEEWDAFRGEGEEGDDDVVMEDSGDVDVVGESVGEDEEDEVPLVRSRPTRSPKSPQHPSQPTPTRKSPQKQNPTAPTAALSSPSRRRAVTPTSPPKTPTRSITRKPANPFSPTVDNISLPPRSHARRGRKSYGEGDGQDGLRRSPRRRGQKNYAEPGEDDIYRDEDEGDTLGVRRSPRRNGQKNYAEPGVDDIYRDEDEDGGDALGLRRSPRRSGQKNYAEPGIDDIYQISEDERDAGGSRPRRSGASGRKRYAEVGEDDVFAGDDNDVDDEEKDGPSQPRSPSPSPIRQKHFSPYHFTDKRKGIPKPSKLGSSSSSTNNRGPSPTLSPNDADDDDNPSPPPSDTDDSKTDTTYTTNRKRAARRRPTTLLKRAAWSASELLALAEGLRRHGTKWSAIEAEFGGRMPGRSQMDMKDKARVEKARRRRCGEEVGVFVCAADR